MEFFLVLTLIITRKVVIKSQVRPKDKQNLKSVIISVSRLFFKQTLKWASVCVYSQRERCTSSFFYYYLTRIRTKVAELIKLKVDREGKIFSIQREDVGFGVHECKRIQFLVEGNNMQFDCNISSFNKDLNSTKRCRFCTYFLL